MAKMVIDFPVNLEKINPKSGPSRRFSTGNEIIKPLPIPNYLRASIGSCHDICKYGTKQHIGPESINTKHGKNASVVINKALGKKKLVPVPSSRQQPCESKTKPLVRSDQSSLKQLNKPSSKSTKNVGKGTRSVPLTSSSLPQSSGKESLSLKSGKSASSPEKNIHLKIKKSVDNSDTCQNTSSGKESLFRRSGKSTSSPEKDIHLEINISIENSETRQNTSYGNEFFFRRFGKNATSMEKDTHLAIKKSVENSETCQNTSSGKESLFQGSGKNASSPEQDTHLETKKSVENSDTSQNTPSGTHSLFRRPGKSSLEKDYCLEVKRLDENLKTCQKTECENVPEKIIHVVEPMDENQDEDLAPNGSSCRELVLSPNQNQRLDSEAESRNKGAGIGKVVPKESDSSSRKLKFNKNGKALEIENLETDFKGKSLRRVVSDGETTDPEKNVTMRGALRHQTMTQKTTNPELMNDVIEETASKLCSKNKVKALVDAFESLITFQDFESPRPCTRSV